MQSSAASPVKLEQERNPLMTTIQSPPHGTPVRVYRNLHRDMFSIQAKTDKGWRVAGRAKWVQLFEPQAIVSEAGRQRVLRTGQKNVHAYLTGRLGATHPIDSRQHALLRLFTYNPKHSALFTYLDDGSPVNFSELDAVYLCYPHAYTWKEEAGCPGSSKSFGRDLKALDARW